MQSHWLVLLQTCFIHPTRTEALSLNQYSLPTTVWSSTSQSIIYLTPKTVTARRHLSSWASIFHAMRFVFLKTKFLLGVLTWLAWHGLYIWGLKRTWIDLKYLREVGDNARWIAVASLDNFALPCPWGAWSTKWCHRFCWRIRLSKPGQNDFILSGKWLALLLQMTLQIEIDSTMKLEATTQI